MTEPTAKHQQEARKPERIRVCVRHGKDDWIGIAYSANAGDPDVIHEYVSASLLSSRDTEIREVLEGLRSYTGCWCNHPDNHASHYLAARGLWDRVNLTESAK